MNAAAQRRLTPWLLGVVLLIGVVLLVFWLGVGRGIRWNPPHAAAALPPVHAGVAAPPPPPLDSYAAVWQHPLFSADRKPAPSAGSKATMGLGELELSGVIITPGLRMALLHNKTGDVAVRVREGEVVPDSGWTLLELKSRSAIFASASGRSELELPVTAPDAMRNERDGAQSNNGMPPNPAPNGMPQGAPPPGAAVMQVLPPGGASPRGPGAPNSDAAVLQSRIEALKAAVQRRRATQQQVAPSNDVPTRDR